MARHTTTATQRKARQASGQIAVDLALAELSTELAAADADDVKSVGLLTVELGAAALVVSVRDSLDRYWYWVIVGLAVSAALVAASLWRRFYATGPDARRFLKETDDATDPRYAAAVAVMGLALSRDNNMKIRRHKGRLYTASFVTLIVTAVGGAAFLLGVH